MDLWLGVKRNITKIGMKVQKHVWRSINSLITYKYTQFSDSWWLNRSSTKNCCDGVYKMI
jgi:hypothetical protein